MASVVDEVKAMLVTYAVVCQDPNITHNQENSPVTLSAGRVFLAPKPAVPSLGSFGVNISREWLSNQS